MRYIIAIFIIIFNLSLKAQSLNNNVLLFPNPTNEVVNIKFSENYKPQGAISITITDILGNKLKVLDFNKETKIQISMLEMNFNAGIYFFKIETQNEVVIKRLFYRP